MSRVGMNTERQSATHAHPFTHNRLIRMQTSTPTTSTQAAGELDQMIVTRSTPVESTKATGDISRITCIKTHHLVLTSCLHIASPDLAMVIIAKSMRGGGGIFQQQRSRAHIINRAQHLISICPFAVLIDPAPDPFDICKVDRGINPAQSSC